MRLFVMLVLLLGLAAPALAQRDKMPMREQLEGKITRAQPKAGAAEEMSVSVGRDAAGAPEAQTGGLAMTKLAPQIQAALAYLIRWGQGPSTVPGPSGAFNADTPVQLPGASATVPAKDLRLILPVHGLTTQADGSVRVQHLALSSKDRVVSGQGRLEFDAQGRVARVTLTK